MDLPFGYFESHLYSDPVTLKLGETKGTAVAVGIHQSFFIRGDSMSFYCANQNLNSDPVFVCRYRDNHPRIHPEHKVRAPSEE